MKSDTGLVDQIQPARHQNDAIVRAVQGFGPPPLKSIVESLSGFTRLSELWEDALRSGDPAFVFDRVAERLGISIRCSENDLARIPESGPVVLVANHPHGLLDGLVLGSVLARRRPDFRFLANSALAVFKGLEDFIIPVDVFGESAHQNGMAIRGALRWLRKGGALIAFPAGEVSALKPGSFQIADREWSGAVVKIAAAGDARIIRAFITGRNSIPFQIAGLAHASLRTALLGRELLNKQGQAVEVFLGKPIAPRAEVHDGEYLRQRTYMLGGRGKAVSQRGGMTMWRKPRAIAPAADPARLTRNINELRPECLLHQSGEYSIYLAPADAMPDVMKEIGRLRELTFRLAGEGTGNSADLDAFDRSYQHLVLWNSTTSEVVGSYRLGLLDRILATSGVRGLYTHTLFDYGQSFLARVSPGIELGRSFIRPEYQRRPQPLYLLWRGIGAFVARNPSYRYLFGPVSISNAYTKASRQLMVAYFRTEFTSKEFGVKPRTPFMRFRRRDELLSDHLVSNVDDLANLVTDLERDGKGLPVLLRQYLGLGAEVVAFNIDRSFSDALDALIVVDLLRCPRAALAKYFNREDLTRYLKVHGLEAGTLCAQGGS